MVSALAAKFERFIGYNHERPHPALNMKYPAFSPRRYWRRGSNWLEADGLVMRSMILARRVITTFSDTESSPGPRQSVPLATAENWRVTRFVRLASRVLLVCAGYYTGAIIGITFNFPPAGISTIWPPNAIALAALLLAPAGTWWVYLLALLPTHLHVVTTFQDNVPLAVMLSQFAGNAVHILVGAIAVRAVVGAPVRFDCLRSTAWFVLLAAIGATAIACLVAVALFLLTDWTTEFWLPWRQRFFSNGLAVLVITPPILLAAAGELVGARLPRRRRYEELALATLGLFAVGMLVFAFDAPGPDIMPALLLAPLPFLLWAAVRLGLGGVCVCLLVVIGLSWATVYAGRWPFATQSTADSVMSLHAFLLAISIPMMFLATLVEERRRNEEVSRLQRDELAHALRVSTLGELAASIAHELGQPLAAITLNAQAGRRLVEIDHTPSDSIGEILDDIDADAKRAGQVIGRLRALFRKERTQSVGLDINKVIENAVGLLRPDFRQGHIALRFAGNETVPSVIGDPVQLQQVVLNLLMNARDAVAAVDDGAREISISVNHPRTGHLLVSVRDSGIGVQDSAQLEKIFEQFVSSKPQGLGLGLTISRSIVEAHRGHIWATLNDGGGLTFHVELPTRETRHFGT